MFEFDKVFSDRIDLITNIIISNYEDASKCFNKKTKYFYISDKMLYSLFTKNNIIKIYKNDKEDGLFELFQEVITRLCRQEKIMIPTVKKACLDENISASCKSYSNEIFVNLKNCIKVMNNPQDIDQNCLKFITTLRHEFQHQKQKKMFLLYMMDRKKISDFSNEERVELLSYITKHYYIEAVNVIESYIYQFGDKINETFINLNNYKKINEKMLEKYKPFYAYELSAYINAIKYFDDLQYKGYFQYNKSVDDYIEDTTVNAFNYSYIKYENLNVEIIKNGIETMLDMFKIANVQNANLDKVYKLFEHINWKEYGEYLQNEGFYLKKTNIISSIEQGIKNACM